MINFNDAFVTLATVNFDKLVQFYRQFLEQEPHKYIPHIYAEFQLNQLRLAIFKPKENNQQEFANPAGSGFSLCLEVEDLEGAIAHLTKTGYPSNNEIITASHGREIYVYDPDGNRLILHQSG